MTTTADLEFKQRSMLTGNYPGPELTVIIPTKNERDNIAPLYERLCRALEEVDWAIIFVDDDSQDGTPKIVCDLARQDRRGGLFTALAEEG